MGEDPNPQTMASPLCWQIKQTVRGISCRILWQVAVRGALGIRQTWWAFGLYLCWGVTFNTSSPIFFAVTGED